jgi:hypothetical protein
MSDLNSTIDTYLEAWSETDSGGRVPSTHTTTRVASRGSWSRRTGPSR